MYVLVRTIVPLKCTLKHVKMKTSKTHAIVLSLCTFSLFVAGASLARADFLGTRSASDTAPVTEIIRDRVNGILVDFFSPRDIADRVEEALDDPGSMQSIRAMARGTIKDRYDLSKLLPRHLRWIRQAMEQR